MRRERLSTAETLGWSAVGFGIGMVGGLWAAGWLGRVTRGRLSDEFRALRASDDDSPVHLAEAISEALAGDPELAALRLRPIAVSRGTVELTGWVPDRRTRARAVRLAGQVPGVDDLINSILVHGEDDGFSPARPTREGRSA